MTINRFAGNDTYKAGFEGKIYLVRVWERALGHSDIHALSINPYLGILSPRASAYFIRRGKAYSATIGGGTVVTAAAYARRCLSGVAAGGTTMTAGAYRLLGVKTWCETSLAADAVADATQIAVDEISGFSVGNEICVYDTAPENTEWSVIELIRAQQLAHSTQLNGAVSDGETQIDVDDASGFLPNQFLTIDSGGSEEETLEIQSVSGASITLKTAMTHDHADNASVDTVPSGAKFDLSSALANNHSDGSEVLKAPHCSTLFGAHITGLIPCSATAAGNTAVTSTIGFKVPVSASAAGSTSVEAAAKVSKIPPYVWDLPVFSFEPDWSQQPKLGMTFITDLHTSDAGSEERNARLDRPKLTQEHVVSAWDDHDVARQIELFIESNMGEQVLVPLWSEAVTLSDAPSGNTIPISSDATGRLFQPTRAVMLWKSPSAHSLAEITAAGASSLTTLNTVPAGYAAGDLAVPVFVSDPIQTGVELEWLNAFHASGASSWKEAAIESEALPMATTLAGYRGLPIFPFPFNWAKGFSTQRSQRIETVESETSIISAITAEPDPRITAPGAVWLDDRPDIARAWTLFCNRRGRQSRLWLPSGKRDLVLAAAQTATSSQLVCAPSGYVTGDYLREQRRVLLIVADGAWHARRVTGAEFDAYDNEVLTLESTVPALPADAVISMLLLTRFDVDDISFSFNHNSQSDWETTLTELPAEYAALLTGVAPANGVLADNHVLLPAT
ncbi:MAG: hypothetical protein WA117_08420 [Verrucomicrobiia bacterium]